MDCVKLLPMSGVNYLDLSLKIEDGEIKSTLYCKPVDCHQYLHYSSCHPHHTKRSICYSEALRIKRICSDLNDYNNNVTKLKQWLSKRKYPTNVINEQCRKAVNYTVVSEDTDMEQKDRDSISPLVVTYHPALNSLSSIMRKHFHVLQANESTQEVFKSAPFVSFRNPKTIRNSLVRAKLGGNVNRKGCFRCGSSKCEVCHNIVETNEFTSTHLNTTYKINFALDCNSICLIYLMRCKICLKQLVGVCTTAWRDRWNNYRDNSRKSIQNQPHFQKEVHNHFKLPGHTSMEKDVEVILIDKTDRMFPKKREIFWIDTLRTMTPDGFNVSETQ